MPFGLFLARRAAAARATSSLETAWKFTNAYRSDSAEAERTAEDRVRTPRKTWADWDTLSTPAPFRTEDSVEPPQR